jgi:hypothetical protein
LVALLKEADNQTSDEERSANADVLLDAVFSLVDSDPVRASELGAADELARRLCGLSASGLAEAPGPWGRPIMPKSMLSSNP